MTDILAIYEVEKLARQLIQKNHKTGVWPLLFLIAMSQQTGYTKLIDVIRFLQPDRGSNGDSFIIKPVQHLIDIELRHDKSRSSSQKPTRYGRLKDHFDLYPFASYEGQLTQEIFTRSLDFARQYSRITSLLVLVQIAISVRRLSSSREIFQYICSGTTAKGAVFNVLEKMADIGQIQMLKTGDHRSAENIIFEI